MSTTTRGSTVVGVFDDREDAREAIEALKDDGFTGDSISILSPDKQATQDIAEETGTHAGARAATGAVAGGILGGLGGWLVGIGALAIPGVGPFIAAGAFATSLGGAAIGAGLGAIAGRCDEAASTFAVEARERDAAATIGELRDWAERLRAAQLGRALARLGHLPERDRRVVEALASGLTNALLHQPTLALKADPDRERAARELFGLADPAAGDAGSAKA